MKFLGICLAFSEIWQDDMSQARVTQQRCGFVASFGTNSRTRTALDSPQQWRLAHVTTLVAAMQSIPTLALATPNADFVPEKVSYYRNSVVPRLYYFSPPLLATLGLFLGFVAWRLVRRCCRCCCQWCCVTPTEVRCIMYG